MPEVQDKDLVSFEKVVEPKNSTTYGIPADISISINGATISTNTITRLRINNWCSILLPTMSLAFVDNGRFGEGFVINKVDVLSVKISSQQNTDPIVQEDFEVMDIQRVNTKAGMYGKYSVGITAIKKVKNFISKSFNRAYPDQVTSDVMKFVADDMGLKYIQEIDTNDKQTWFHAGKNVRDFSQHVLNRAFYKDNDVCMSFYDKGSLVYTSVGKSLEGDPKFSLTEDIVKSSEQLEDANDRDDGNRVYYRNIQESDISGTILEEIGAGYSYSVWDTNAHKTTQTKFNPKEMSDVPSVLNGEEYRNLGQYGYKSDNKHNNYEKAISQQSLRHMYFTKAVTIQIKPNGKVRLMNKVRLLVPSYNDNDINNPLSGTYLVGGMQVAYDRGSPLVQSLVLFRNGNNKQVMLGST